MTYRMDYFQKYDKNFAALGDIRRVKEKVYADQNLFKKKIDHKSDKQKLMEEIDRKLYEKFKPTKDSSVNFVILKG